ncbi:hypothetical protein BsWGS_08600 [Bradybaena similaris]
MRTAMAISRSVFGLVKHWPQCQFRVGALLLEPGRSISTRGNHLMLPKLFGAKGDKQVALTTFYDEMNDFLGRWVIQETVYHKGHKNAPDRDVIKVAVDPPLTGGYRIFRREPTRWYFELVSLSPRYIQTCAFHMEHEFLMDYMAGHICRNVVYLDGRRLIWEQQQTNSENIAVEVMEVKHNQMTLVTTHEDGSRSTVKLNKE